MKITTIIGARPQFIKAAVVSRVFQAYRTDVHEAIIHTSQHYDTNMSDVFFEELDIPQPNHHLNIGGGTHGQNTGRMLESIETILIQEKPDHISNMLFTPTDTATHNLMLKGITGDSVQQVGDVMYDAVLYYRNKAVHPVGIQHEEGFILATVHRAENTDNPERLANIVGALNEIAMETPVILPLHPRTRKLINQAHYDTRHINLLAPVSYLQMIWLLEHCKPVVTDSGGL